MEDFTEVASLPTRNPIPKNRKVYHNDEIVYISNKIVRLYSTTHSLAHVNSVGVAEVPPNYLLNILIALVIVIAVSFLVGLASSTLGVGIFILGLLLAFILILFFSKSKYSVHVRMSSGEFDTVTTKSKDYAHTISREIIQAIVENH